MSKYTVTIKPGSVSGWDVYIQSPAGHYLNPNRGESYHYNGIPTFSTAFHWWAQMRARRLVKMWARRDRKNAERKQKQAARTTGSFEIEV